MVQHRSARAGVEDRWRRADGTPTVADGKGSRWRARWVDADGREVSKSFATKALAQKHIEGVSASLVRGDYIKPEDAALTVRQWCERWLGAYQMHRPSTVRQARTHVVRINDAMGDKRLSDVKPSTVKAWIASMQSEGLKPSTVYALHSRLAQIMADAVHDGVLHRSPCSRRTSPPMGRAKAYVASSEQIWMLHDALEPENLRPAILLGAFAGLRVGEVCGLRVQDVDFMRGSVTPKFQADGEPLKTEGSESTVPIPRQLAVELSSYLERFPGEYVVNDGLGRQVKPFTIERAVRRARRAVEGLPETFTHHDCRHHYASILIAGGADIKTIQARMRHASARVTLDVYGHLMNPEDDSTRDLIAGAMGARVKSPADSLRTIGR